MHIYLRVLVVGQPGVEVGDAGVQNGVARDEGGLGGAGLVPVVVFVIFILGSFEIPLGECAAPVGELYLNQTSHGTAQWMKPFCVKT